MTRSLRRQHSGEGRARASLEALEGKRTIKGTTSALAGCGKLSWHARTSIIRTWGANPVCLVIWFLWSIWFVWFIELGPVQPSKPDRPFKPDRLNRPNEQDRLADSFSILPP